MVKNKTNLILNYSTAMLKYETDFFSTTLLILYTLKSSFFMLLYTV